MPRSIFEGQYLGFEFEFEKYNQEFDKLGNQLKTTIDTYQRVETTRTRQLTRVVEKIRLESGEETAANLLEEPVGGQKPIN